MIPRNGIDLSPWRIKAYGSAWKFAGEELERHIELAVSDLCDMYWRFNIVLNASRIIILLHIIPVRDTP